MRKFRDELTEQDYELIGALTPYGYDEEVLKGDYATRKHRETFLTVKRTFSNSNVSVILDCQSYYDGQRADNVCEEARWLIFDE